MTGSSVDRVLDAIDVGLQRAGSVFDLGPGEQGYGTDRNPERCARCQRHDPAEGGDLCAGCRAFLLGDTDDDPIRPARRRDHALEVVLGVSLDGAYVHRWAAPAVGGTFTAAADPVTVDTIAAALFNARRTVVGLNGQDPGPASRVRVHPDTRRQLVREQPREGPSPFDGSILTTVYGVPLIDDPDLEPDTVEVDYDQDRPEPAPWPPVPLVPIPRYMTASAEPDAEAGFDVWDSSLGGVLYIVGDDWRRARTRIPAGLHTRQWVYLSTTAHEISVRHLRGRRYRPDIDAVLFVPGWERGPDAGEVQRQLRMIGWAP